MTEIHLLFSDEACKPQHNLCMAKQGVVSPDEVAAASGQRIREGREAKKWTQEQLAKATGWNPDKPSRAQKTALSMSRIANFEQGTRRVGYEEAEIFERVLGMPAPYYMGVITDQEAAVLAALRGKQDPFPQTPVNQVTRRKAS
jgi:transcriptional regulator with XRE-family HTH domain